MHFLPINKIDGNREIKENSHNFIVHENRELRETIKGANIESMRDMYENREIRRSWKIRGKGKRKYRKHGK